MCRNDTGLTVLNRSLRFYFILDFFGWLGSACQVRQQTTGLPVLSVQHVNLTQVLDGESIPLRSSRAPVSLSLDAVVVGEEDEHEEDVG